MQITMINHNNAEYEAKFDDLINEVFGFSFAPWFERGLWDERYESYSIIENGRMLSNVCVLKADLTVCGRRFRAHQFGAVTTRKNMRGKGLSRLIMEHVLEKYSDVPSFLFANPGVLEFYPRFGFRRVQAYRPIVEATINNPTTIAIKLAPDDALLRNALQNRKIFSETLDCLNTAPVQMFHLLLDYRDGIYYLPDCGVVAVAEQDGERLFIADIISERPVSFDTIRRELPFNGVRYAEFGFCPDRLDISPEWVPADMDKEPFFIRGDWTLPERYRFPTMSET